METYNEKITYNDEGTKITTHKCKVCGVWFDEHKRCTKCNSIMHCEDWNTGRKMMCKNYACSMLDYNIGNLIKTKRNAHFFVKKIENVI